MDFKVIILNSGRDGPWDKRPKNGSRADLRGDPQQPGDGGQRGRRGGGGGGHCVLQGGPEVGEGERKEDAPEAEG